MNPIVGFRGWSIKPEEPDLLFPCCHVTDGIRQRGPWRGQRAGCHICGGKDTPALHKNAWGDRWADKCGYHADVLPSTKSWRIGVDVRGAALAWGRVVLHEYGWRSEYAKPIALLRGPRSAAPARYYGIPVVETEEELIAVATEHGDLYVPEGVTT